MMTSNVMDVISSRYNVEAPDASIWTVIVYQDLSVQLFAALEYIDRYSMPDEDSALIAIESGTTLDPDWQVSNSDTGSIWDTER